MAKKKKIPSKLQVWIDARKRYKLSHAQVQMARELGLNPKKLGKLANHDQEPWKMPLPQFIESIYLERFDRELPEVVKSMEQISKERQQKREERRRRKQEARADGECSQETQKLDETSN